MPDCRDAQIRQVISRQGRKNRFVNLVFAERSLIPSKAKAPQPDHDVHDGPKIRAPHTNAERPGEVLGGVKVPRGLCISPTALIQ